MRTLKRLYVDEDFKKGLKIQAAEKGITVAELTRRIAKENNKPMHIEPTKPKRTRKFEFNI